MINEIDYPFTLAKIKDLKIGAAVKLSGLVFTGRDRLHKHLFEGGKCPVNLKDGAIFHAGPLVMCREGVWIMQAIGPTTSMRHDLYMPKIIAQHHVRVIIGKGGMGKETQKTCAKYGCVYLQAVGGVASLLASKIEKVAGVHFIKEFGTTEALWELILRNFEAIVTIDVHGRSLHKKVETTSKRVLKKMLQKNPF